MSKKNITLTGRYRKIFRAIKNKLLFKCLLVLFIAAALFSCRQAPPAGKSDKVIKVGYMICNSEAETLERFRPLTAWMSKKLGVKMDAVAVDTFKFTREVDDMDFTHTNSLLYVILKRLHGVKVLTADKQGSLGFRSNGAIVATRDSDIKDIKDLKGKKMIFWSNARADRLSSAV